MVGFPLNTSPFSPALGRIGSSRLPAALVAGSQAFRAAAMVFDDFNRADTAPGTVGVPEIGSTWLFSGTGAGGVQIVNKRVVSPTGTTYMYQALPQAPRHFSSHFSLTGALPGSAYAMILSADASVTLQHMLHTNFFPGGGGTTIWTPTNGGNQLMSVSNSFATSLPNDGRVLRADIWVNPVATTVQVQIVDTTTGQVLVVTSGSDPLVPFVIGSTPLVIVEPVTLANGFSTLYRVQVDNPALPASYDRDNGQPGMYAGPNWGYPGPFTMGAGVVTLQRFVPSRNLTVASIAYAVDTAGSGADTSDVGIYGIGTGNTLTRLGNAGSGTRTGATGVQNVALTAATSLYAGTPYYSALAAPGAFGTSAPVLAGLVSAASTQNFVQLFGPAPPRIEIAGYVNTGLPASIPYASIVAQGTYPRLAIRES